MVRRCVVYAVAVACSSVAPHAFAQAEPRAVIELFTSQGCSSCPAADKLAGEFAADPGVLVMSLAIDYWDYLGWKDTLALHGHSERQSAYAASRADREVATPQAVINGVVAVVGSDMAALPRLLAMARSIAARSLPSACKLPFTTTCGV